MTARLFLRILALARRACPIGNSLVALVLAILLCLPLVAGAAPISTTLAPGLNLVGVTAELVTGNSSAFPLLSAWKASGVTAVEAYDAVSGKMLRAELDGAGNPSGADFPLVENRALHVYSSQSAIFSLGDSAPCGPLDLAAGLNLASHACFPPNYPVSEFITSIGLTNITSLSRLDTSSGRWQTAAVDSGAIVGEDFPLVAGEGYIIHAGAIAGWSAPLSLTPTSLIVQQGQPDVSLTVSIPFTAPAGGAAVDLVSSDPALVAVAAQVTVPAGSSSVSVPLIVPDTGITAVQAVTLTASHSGLTNAQAALSVHPKPTINLSPLTTVTGLTLTYPLTVNLSDIAPPGGLTVTLTAAPAGIVTLPASVTIPAGASSAQVTVTALSTLGSAVITAISPGRGFSGAQHGVTVKATQSANYTPLVSRQLGVQVALAATAPQNTTYTPITSAQLGVQVALPPPSPTIDAIYTPITSAPLGVNVTVVPPVNQNVGYGPLMTPPVGVTVGSTITSVTPVSGAIGATGIKVRVVGVGLGSASAISFQPATGITIQPASFAIVDGNPEVTIDIAADAPVAPRTVLVALSTGGYALPTDAGSNQFRVTLPTPQIYNVSPLRATVGQGVTMTIIGKNLTSASSVNFVPADGITVNNPPTVTGGGTGITTTFTIGANATPGTRAVTVTAPGGTSTAVADHTNSFTVTAANDPGVVHTAFTSGVGVLVETPPAPTDQQVNYGPTTSLPLGVVVEIPPPSPEQQVVYGPTVSQSLGVTVGATIQRITPLSGNIASSLTVRAEGVGLDGASAISFQPATGITVDSFAIVGGNPEANITIAADAPVTPRTVLVALSSGGYALPTVVGSNQFRVTLPQPEVFSLQPIRAMVGQVVAMTILGKDFGAASSVNFTPPTGITVTNPPTVSPDGKMITVNFTIAADAVLGSRVVTVTTPGGVTSATATTANSFSVTADMGVTYTPLLSAGVGVMVTVPPPPTNQDIYYGPLNSEEVGVMVTVPSPPASLEVDYGPLVSTQVGVAVGGHFTGFSPFALEPGSSASFTLTGVGLDSVTSISVVPAADMTVTDWTPAGDGLSGTVTIAAGSAAVSGIRTLVPLVGSTALPPSAAGAALLRVGYKPIANAITTSYPTSTVQATAGTTVTLTMYGLNLQGVTRVEVLPADGITIDTVPVWFADNEHVSVTVIIAANAAIGPRLVKLTTPYGSTSSVLGVTNTLTIVTLTGSSAPASEATGRLVARKDSEFFGSDSLTVVKLIELYGLSAQKLDLALVPSLTRIPTAFATNADRSISTERMITAVVLPDASRDPPEV